MSKLNQKKIITILIKIAGYIIVLISFFYIAFIIRDNFSHIKISKIQKLPLSILYIFILSLAYTFIVFLFSLSWKFILDFVSLSHTNTVKMFTVYGKANIAKYMPGNVFHFVGRNVLGKKFGISHSDLALTTILEVIITIFTVIILCLGYIVANYGYFLEKFSFLKGSFSFIVAVISVFFLVLILFFNKKLRGKIEKFFTLNFLFLFFKTFIIYILIFFISTFILVFIYDYILGENVEKTYILSFFSFYVISWFMGLVTVGSPGGLGVRESFLILFLSRFYGEDITIIAVFLHRIIALSGEVFAFLLANFLAYHFKAAPGIKEKK